MVFQMIILWKYSCSNIKSLSHTDGNRKKCTALLYLEEMLRKRYYIAEQTGIFAIDVARPTLILLSIEFLWLALLANATGLWKINTLGKTGRKTPQELLHDSAPLSLQEAQAGNNFKSFCKACGWMCLWVTFNVCIASELLLQLLDALSQYAWLRESALMWHFLHRKLLNGILFRLHVQYRL